MNFKHTILALALVLGTTATQAEINSIDNVPAATLLAPYFDIDLANANGVRTTLTIGNASAVEQVAHVTLWTDFGVPSLNFDVRLDARDTLDIDLRALFTSGALPSSTAGGFGSCSALLPPVPLSAGQLTGLRNAHTGAASTLLGGQCGGSAQADGHARGFITIDVVSGCSTLFPGDAGYFVNGGTGTAKNDNVLWGEMLVSNPSIGVTYGDALVHVEADASDVLTDGVDELYDHDFNPATPMIPRVDYTFYRRMGATAGADNREALGLDYQARYQNTAAVSTQAIVWRDPGDVAPFACGSPPSTAPGGGQIVAFDQEEQVATDQAAAMAPLATQMIDLDDAATASIPFAAGNIQYTLPRALADGALELRNQGYVAHLLSTGDSTSVSRGWAVTTAESSNHMFLGVGFPECNDGMDNDGDGDADYPADAQCLSPTTALESTQCSDGIDNNDSDTLIDLNDPDCESSMDQFEDDGFDNQCSDGVDNDGDGLFDWPADPQCFHPNDFTEANQCGDGIDNDSDGLVDFPADLGCASANDNGEFNAQCIDGTDNDGDGLIDYPADPGCTNTEDGSEASPVCSDGLDNDADGLIDFPNDPGCSSALDSDEANPACSDGADNDGDGLIDFPNDPGCASAQSTVENPNCSDGSDNDGDTFIDFPNDPECLSPAGVSEYGYPACGDGIDNDGDGQADYPADPQCQNSTDPMESAAECSDGLDNDGDGRTDYPNSPTCSSADDPDEAPDCSDVDAFSNPPNVFDIDNDRDGLANFPADPGCASAVDLNELGGSTTRACSDGVDNDLDGYVDYPEDAGCTSAYDDLEYVPGQIVRAPVEPYVPVPVLSHLALALMAALFALAAAFGLRRVGA